MKDVQRKSRFIAVSTFEPPLAFSDPVAVVSAPVIGIDLGGTRIKAALIDGPVVRLADSIAAHSSAGLEPQLPRVAAMIHDLCQRAGIAASDCAGLGMAVPFLVDPGACQILSVPKEKYGDAAGLGLREWAREAFKLDFKMENDAHAACLGEWRHGAAVGVDDLVMFTLGTGIGCSVVLRGRPLRGKRFQAGVLCGHFIADPAGEPCVCCPANGCFESQAASRSLPGHARREPGFADSALAGESEIDFKAVFDHAARGDRVAIAVRDRVVGYWSALAVNVCAAYDPDLIVVGGAVAGSAAEFLPAMRDYVGRHAWTVRPPEIVPAALANHAGLIGIASLFTTPTQCL